MVGNADIVGRACVGRGWLERELTRPAHTAVTENGKDAEEEEKLIKLKAQHKNKWIFGELSPSLHMCISHPPLAASTHVCYTLEKKRNMGACTCTGLNQPNESTQCTVQYHHDGKTNHNTTIDPFGIAVLVCFHEQFSTADVYHGSCCTCQ
jgi:hypothetical protein